MSEPSQSSPPPREPEERGFGWQPGHPSWRGRRSDTSGIFWGLVLLAVGAYFLLTETFGLRLPDIGELWPVFVIALGAWILWTSMRRERR
jgi:hypothetical protein